MQVPSPKSFTHKIHIQPERAPTLRLSGERELKVTRDQRETDLRHHDESEAKDEDCVLQTSFNQTDEVTDICIS